jgi:REP element-mobilizing transposase RayT
VSFYRRNLPHLQRDDKPHFLTFATRHRWILPEWTRYIVLECCLHDHGIRYDLHAAVVMPDHGHAILTPKIEDGTVIALHEIMRVIKSVDVEKVTELVLATAITTRL